MANRTRVFMDISIGQQPAGRLTLELFTDKAPRTCENFRQLCTGEHNGLSYTHAPFHRIIDEFMVQGGDIDKGDGTGTISIYDGEFEDENLDWRHMDAAGLLCSANRGRDTNGSQFFLTLEPCPHLNGKHTIFGRLVSGDDTLSRLSKVAVDKNDRPLDPVLVARCGELEKKKVAKSGAPREPIPAKVSDDRGRRRRSDQDETDEDMGIEDATPPERLRRRRRQSDNVVDEGIRGRPRLRSASRSPSRPHMEESENASDHSEEQIHKRKRSPSPSRHVDGRSEKTGDLRRRRSLPNQYEDSHGRSYDEDRYRPSPRRNDHRHSGRRGDDHRYRAFKDRHPEEDGWNSGGRLGGDSTYSNHDAPVKFKGRGVMKYREPDRAWS